MAKTADPQLLAQLREESERTLNDPYPQVTRPQRPNRSQVYSVRLSAEEQARVQNAAEELQGRCLSDDGPPAAV